MNVTSFAQELIDRGLSVIPISSEGKNPTVPWQFFQERLPIIGEKIEVERNGKIKTSYLTFNGSIALVCGKVSGNVECLDIDVKHDPTIFERFKERCSDFWDDLYPRLLVQRTRSGGYHLVYKCDVIEGNQKLANKAGEKPGVAESMLETRGQGGYFLIAPTPGYEMVQGDFHEIPTITPQERQMLFDCARSLNEVFIEVKPIVSKLPKPNDRGERPGDIYNKTASIPDILTTHGWTLIREYTDQSFFKRPGNTDSKWSGSFKSSTNTFYVYTSSIAELQAGHAYTPFTLLTMLDYQGDWGVCAKALYQLQNPDYTPVVREVNEDGEVRILTRIQKIERWLRDNFEFRRNSITGMVSAMDKSLGVWEPCNDATIWREAQHNLHKIGQGKRGGELSVPLHDISALLSSDFVPEFDPFQEFFNSLPTWDGRDHLKALSNHITTDQPEFWDEQFKKAMVRMVACTLGGVVNRIVMTLISEQQELGKSQFIRFLCPPKLRPYYKEEPLTHDKDSDIALAENFLWNLEELDDLNKKQISDLKAVISKASVKQRRAYGKHEKSMRRIVNFWGSTNKTDFLTDTQNTRWLCFTVLSINHDYDNLVTGKKNIDIEQVWAQAYHLYQNKFNYQLNKSDRDIRDTVNRTFETMSDEKELIIRHFKPAKPGESLVEFKMNSEIKEYLNKVTHAKTRVNEYNIGRAMKQLGFIQESRWVNNKTVRGYLVTTLYTTPSLNLTPQPVHEYTDEELKETPF